MHLLKRLLLLIALFIAAVLIFPVGYFVLEETYSSAVMQEGEGPYQEIGSFLINLDRSVDRYKFVEPKIRALGYPVQRISAIDGAKLSESALFQKIDFQKYRSHMGSNPKRGTIGCSLSHIKAWQSFLESNYEFAIIFEDDVDFEPQKLFNIVGKLTQDKKLWDIVSFEISHKGTPVVIKHYGEDDLKLVVYLTEVTHAGAYLISREAARKLLQKALPITMPIDHYFTRGWELDLKFTGIEPRLVYQRFGSSVIATTSPKYETEIDGSTFATRIQMGIYKFQSYIIRFFYNLYLSTN